MPDTVVFSSASPLLSLTNTGTGSAVNVTTAGQGVAAYFTSSDVNNFQPMVQVSNAGMGGAMILATPQSSNVSNALSVTSTSAGSATNQTIGNAANFVLANTAGYGSAVRGETTSGISGMSLVQIGDNMISAGIHGVASGTAGYAGAFETTNQDGNGNALLATTMGSGIVAKFIDLNINGVQPVVYIEQNDNGPVLVVAREADNSDMAIFSVVGRNVIRFDHTGKGFFNGGTQNSGADLAEAFAVEGSRSDYSPGDVLLISTTADRAVVRSNEAYSSLVAGVYATKPGVLLTEAEAVADPSIVGICWSRADVPAAR